MMHASITTTRLKNQVGDAKGTAEVAANPSDEIDRNTGIIIILLYLFRSSTNCAFGSLPAGLGSA